MTSTLMRKTTIHLLSGAVFFFSHSVFAATLPADGASVNYVNGKVEIIVHGAVSDAKSGQALAKGDVLRTGKDAAAILQLADGSQVKLNPETTLEIGATGKDGTELALGSGAVFSKVAKQKANSRFIIRTRTAVMGVRGTEFYTAFGKATQAGADVWMCVHEGKVEVESVTDHKKVLVNQGEGVFVPVDKGVTPPQKYVWTENLNWNMNPASGELIDRTRIDYQELLKQDYD